MNTKLLWSVGTMGLIMILISILLGLFGAEFLSSFVPQINLVPFALGFIGVFLILVVLIPIFYEKNKTKEQLIEEKDERINQIYLQAKANTFNLMVLIIPFALLSLALLGSMNKIPFFIFSGLYLVFIGYYIFLVMKNQQEM